MKSRVIFPLVAVATLIVASSEANAFGLLSKMVGGGCCAPSCCEATCGAAAPACCEATCAAAAPACEPTCCAKPSCCNDNCCNSCCRPTPIRDLLARIHCKLQSLRCCHSSCGSCCEATCAAAEPACGCAK